MKRLGIVVGALCLLVQGAWAACPTTSLTFKDAAGATQTLCFGLSGAGFYLGQSEPISSSGAALDGTAGTAAAGVLTVQGIASMTKLLVTPDSVALPANQSVNVSQWNGQTAANGGVTGSVLVEQGCAGQTVANTFVKPFSLASTTSLKIVPLVSTKKVYICGIDIVSGTAQNVALIEGTKTTTDCDTSTAGLAGGTTAATGWNFAANGGHNYGNGQGVVFKSATASLDVCLLSSSTGQISGAITYAQF